MILGEKTMAAIMKRMADNAVGANISSVVLIAT